MPRRCGAWPRRKGRGARAMVRRGEVRWAQHPDWPRRPALLLTRDEAIDRLNEVFVVLATTKIRGLPTEVELGVEDGMPRACVLNATTWPRSRRAISATSSPRWAQRGWPRSAARWIAQPAADAPSVRPQCVPQARNQPLGAAFAGQAEARNLLHISAFRDLSCHALTVPFRLDKAEVAGSSPASSTPVATGDSVGPPFSSVGSVRTLCAHLSWLRAALIASAAGVRGLSSSSSSVPA
jgi:hypothetical protein